MDQSNECKQENESKETDLQTSFINMARNNDVFRGNPCDEAMRCLEGISTCPNYIDQSQIGQLYQTWFYSSTTRPPINVTRTSLGGRRRNIYNMEEFLNIESLPIPPPLNSPILQLYVPPPPRGLLPIFHPHNYTVPVFSASHGIPIMSAVASGPPGSVAFAHVRPQYVEPAMAWTAAGSTRNMPYPPPRHRNIQVPGTFPRHPPTRSK